MISPCICIPFLRAAILYFSLIITTTATGLLAAPNEELTSGLTNNTPAEAISNIGKLMDRINFSLLIETGAAYRNVNAVGESESDFALSTVEIAMEAMISSWVTCDVALLFEDPIFDDADADVALDSGTITLGDTAQFPLYVTAGKFYMPYGALLTHFPDSPLMDLPVTLSFGEISERAILVGTAIGNWHMAGYAFNGSVEKTGDDENATNTFGADLNYTCKEAPGKPGVMFGTSYISNLADTDGISELIPDNIEDKIAGLAVYLSGSWGLFFLDVEYMTALSDFHASELMTQTGEGAKPVVWNIEAGYNFSKWCDAEIVFKYSGSDEAEALGIPEIRYGVALNLMLCDHTMLSVGGLHDQFANAIFDNGTEDERHSLFMQIAIEL